MRKLFRTLASLALPAAALACLPASSAMAAWNSTAEVIANHHTWIYVPSSTMSNGKRPLLIVLHGCAQTADELKTQGNLTATADNNAMVVAVPNVDDKVFQGNPAAKCWDYNGATDSQGDIADIVNLAGNLKARGDLHIDANHVYVAGLSSGAALSLDVACKAPDVFAGVAALAGPSVGSNQNNALAEASGIPSSNVDNAVGKCKSLAGSKTSAFDTQIAIASFGDMDLNGPNERFRFNSLSLSDRTTHAGQIALVSVKWTQDNVKAFQKLYGTGALGAAESVQADFGTQQVATKNGKPRISLLAMRNIGHAWAAGTGKPNSPPPDGIWIAQSGLNFPAYIASWLIANNLRAQPSSGPQVTATASVSADKVIVTGTATNPGGGAPRVATSLVKSSSGQQIDNHDNIPVKTDGSYSDTFNGVQDDVYKAQVTATDSANNSAVAITNDVVVGNSLPPSPPPCFTDNNYNHVRKGRAALCSNGFVCAKGSGDNLGLYSLGITSSVVENPPGFFRNGGSCPAQ
jgi:poly(3-hydroxybutyrate) depolymerase